MLSPHRSDLASALARLERLREERSPCARCEAHREATRRALAAAAREIGWAVVAALAVALAISVAAAGIAFLVLSGPIAHVD